MRPVRHALAVLALSAAGLATADTESAQGETLWGFGPSEIRRDGETVRIVTRQTNLSEQIYRNHVMAYCGVLVHNPTALDGVKNAVFLDAFRADGFVFAGGKMTCRSYLSQPGDAIEDFVDARTISYDRTASEAPKAAPANATS